MLSVVYIGAFEASRSWGDLFALLVFGVFGWLMKQFKWPRPPLVLGLVLGDSIERYMFISIERYGFSWLARPVVAVLLILAIVGLVRPFIADVRRQGGIGKMAAELPGADTSSRSSLFTIFFIALIGTLVVAALPWHFAAKLVPLIVGSTRADGRGPEPVQRTLPQARGGRGSRQPGRAGAGRGRADDPHGSGVRHRPPAGCRPS